jgi:hypothetical protein
MVLVLEVEESRRDTSALKSREGGDSLYVRNPVVCGIALSFGVARCMCLRTFSAMNDQSGSRPLVYKIVRRPPFVRCPILPRGKSAIFPIARGDQHRAHRDGRCTHF